MRCTTCRGEELSEIRLVLRGNSITMHSCMRCESRWWDQDGERVALHDVLRLASPE